MLTKKGFWLSTLMSAHNSKDIEIVLISIQANWVSYQFIGQFTKPN